MQKMLGGTSFILLVSGKEEERTSVHVPFELLLIKTLKAFVALAQLLVLTRRMFWKV